MLSFVGCSFSIGLQFIRFLDQLVVLSPPVLTTPRNRSPDMASLEESGSDSAESFDVTPFMLAAMTQSRN
jgi:hypothetical protein